MKGNNQLPTAHFKKDWQGNTINGQCRVRTWLNQGASRARSETRLRD
jgi:large subunit ribosomal protein L13e